MNGMFNLANHAPFTETKARMSIAAKKCQNFMKVSEKCED